MDIASVYRKLGIWRKTNRMSKIRRLFNLN